MGYTPAFDTIYTGTLFGKWPMAAVWASLIPLIDRHGQINLSFEAISGMTGWPMDLLQQGISQLELPDPGSRTDTEEGRRIIRLDPRRPWGWRVVNHAIYREKARKQMHNERAVESGANRDRLKTRRDQTRPDATGDDRLSDSDSDSYTNKKKSAGIESPLALHASLPEESWEEWLAHRREKRLSMSPRALNKQLKLLAEYPTAIQREIIDTSINAGWEGLFRPKGKAAKQEAKGEWM